VPVAVTYNPVIDTRFLYPGPPSVVAHLRERTARDHARVFFTGFRAANFGTIFRRDEFGGWDGMTPRRVEQLADPLGSLDTAASGAFLVTAPVASAVFDLLGIRYLMLAPGAPSPAPHLVRDYDGPSTGTTGRFPARSSSRAPGRASTTPRRCASSTTARSTRGRRC